MMEGDGMFGHPEYLTAVWLVPALAVFCWLAHRGAQAALRTFASEAMVDRGALAQTRRTRVVKALLLALGAGALLTALARPRWGDHVVEIERRGRDIVFILDVSKSMLARDVAPNRLERAKLDIRDMVEKLDGDRIGLVVFAGKAVVRCPLTLDVGFFLNALDNVDVTSAPPGGTKIGDAIRIAAGGKNSAGMFDDRIKAHKAIVLITDGEDHDSFPVEAAQHARQKGIAIFAISRGDPEKASHIPLAGTGTAGYLEFEGERVRTRMQDEQLKKIATLTGGAYLPAGTRDANIGAFYLNHVAQIDARLQKSRKQVRKHERFALFVFIAIVALLIEGLLSEVRAGGRLFGRKLAMLIVVGALGLPATAQAADTQPPDAGREPGGAAASAEQELRAALERRPEHAGLHYNLGRELFTLRQFDTAAEAFARARELADTVELEAKAQYNLGCVYAAKTDLLIAGEESLENLEKAVRGYRAALEHFRDALELIPDDVDTRHNVMAVKLKLKMYLDKLRKKEAEKRTEQKSAFEILEMIIDGEKELRQNIADPATIDTGRRSPVAVMMDKQDLLLKDLETFETAVMAELKNPGAAQGGQPPSAPVGDPERIGKAIEFISALSADAREGMKKTMRFLDRDPDQAAEAVNAVLGSLDKIWKVLAPPMKVLKRDIGDQTELITHGEADRSAPGAKGAVELIAEQRNAAELTMIFREKIRQTPVPAEPGADASDTAAAAAKKMAEKIDRAVELSNEAEGFQHEAVAALKKDDCSQALPKQNAALEKLREIEKLFDGEKDKDDQDEKQDKNEQQKNNENDKQKQEQQQKERQERQKEEMNKQRAENMIDKVNQRKREHDKKMKEIKGTGVIISGERDW